MRTHRAVVDGKKQKQKPVWSEKKLDFKLFSRLVQTSHNHKADIVEKRSVARLNFSVVQFVLVTVVNVA